MRNTYLLSLNKAIEDFKTSVKINNVFSLEKITSLIAFCGLSPIEKFENNNIENSCNLFPNLEELIIFCTKSSLENAKNSKSFNINKNISIDIHVLEENSSYKNLYIKLLDVVKNKDFNNIFLDTTQGMKSISITFYKLSIELGIKSLAWETLHRKELSGYLIRRADVIKINLLDNPKLENYNYFRLINNLIDNYNFSIVGELYETINNIPLSLFFKGLGKIFNESSLDFKNFKNSIEEFLTIYSKLCTSDQKKFFMIKNLFSFFLLEPSSDVSIVNFSHLLIEDFKDSITFDELEYLHSYLMVPYILKKFPSINIQILILKNLHVAFFNLDIKYENTLPEMISMLNIFFNTREVNTLKKDFFIIDYLKEDNIKFFSLELNKIIINNFTITINKNNLLKKYFNNDLKSLVLKKILSTPSLEVNIEDIKKIMKDLSIKHISKAFTILEKDFKILNQELNNIFLQENLSYHNIFIYIPNKETRKNNNFMLKIKKIYLKLDSNF